MPAQRSPLSPAEAGQPFRATLTTAAINSARAARSRSTEAHTPDAERPASGRQAPTHSDYGVTDFTVPVPTPRPESAPPGSRPNWPLVGPADEHAAQAGGGEPYGLGDLSPSGPDQPAQPAPTDGRVTPPWQADDLLPPEPPMLRLVEPPPLADRALREESTSDADSRFNAPPLRLVEPEPQRRDRGHRGPRNAPERTDAPVPDEADGDLLIFAAARSAWFVGHSDDELEWSSSADRGWQAAASAARPAVGAETGAGLPRRVPQANLVPGSALRNERPLQIVRDAASIAANTTGYFRGWRRGQEIGGYAPGGRPGRESARGWDFSRDDNLDDDHEYEYRSAGYRS